MDIRNTLLDTSKNLFYIVLGGLGSYVIYEKISHLSQYHINKSFGDYRFDERSGYNNVKTTLDGKIIVKRATNNYWLFQNFALATSMVAISIIAYRTLNLYGCSKSIINPVLIGAVATPILSSLFKIISGYCFKGFKGTWVELTEKEIQRYNIKREWLQMILYEVRGYDINGEFRVFQGEFHDDHWNP